MLPGLLAAIALSLSAAAMAQPPGEPVDPLLVLDEIAAAYREAPLAELVTVTLRPEAAHPAQSRFTIRMAPGQDAAGGVGTLFLELGDLRIHIADGLMTVIHAADPGTHLQHPYDGPITPALLAQLLPPIPLPQLALAADAGAHNLTPYTPVHGWTGATLDDSPRRAPLFRLVGWGPAGEVQLAADARTGRLVSFKARAGGPDGLTDIELAFRPLDPGAPESWRIDLTGRQGVATLAELKGERPILLSPGDGVPDIILLSHDLAAWGLHDFLRRPSTPRPAALLFFRIPADAPGELPPDAFAGLEAIRLVRHGPRAGGPPHAPLDFIERAAAIIDLGFFSRDLFAPLRSAWARAGASRPALESDDLMWASSSAQLLERFDPRARAILAVIAPDRTLRAVIPLDGRADEAGRIAAELRAALAGP